MDGEPTAPMTDIRNVFTDRRGIRRPCAKVESDRHTYAAAVLYKFFNQDWTIIAI
jgi:hypothetical protein